MVGLDNKRGKGINKLIKIGNFGIFPLSFLVNFAGRMDLQLILKFNKNKSFTLKTSRRKTAFMQGSGRPSIPIGRGGRDSVILKNLTYFMRLLKSNVILRLVNSYVVDSPQPANISYLWNFGSLLGTCLILQILTGVFLAMHYTPNVDFAFTSVEHIISIPFLIC